MNRLLRKAAWLGFAAALTCFALDRMLPPDLARYRDVSPKLRDKAGKLLHVGLTEDGYWRMASTPEDVDRRYVDLLLKTEDKRFYLHPGVDPLALGRALWQLVSRGHIVSGGSTLTMQVARVLAPHRHDVIGKFADIARALQLEWRYSKRDILSMYLTLAPFGGNIEGVRAASLIYFGTEPENLTNEQASLLVALPRNPERLRPDRHLHAALEAAHRVWVRAKGASAPWGGLVVERHDLPALAPHFAERMFARYPHAITRSSLDGGVQEAVEDLARREVPWLGEKADMAALVIDNRRCSVLAYLGGVNYIGPAGMVDAVRARLSPGSTLKPFIYGMAFDDSVALPTTLIDDRPMREGDYAPHNFDRLFHGTVTVREALQQSYNLPAVLVLNRVGPARFAARLAAAGVSLSLPSQSVAPGLPIALGGVGISLENLAMLYTGLADRGTVCRLNLLNKHSSDSRMPVMSAKAAREVTTILRGTPRPDGIAPERFRPIAYKTGTSFGFHDAWAAGYTTDYTIVVWVGRKDGSARPGAMGIGAAAPILFKIFDLLPAERAAPEVVPPSAPEVLAPLLDHFQRFRYALIDRSPVIVFPPKNAILDAGLSEGSPEPLALEASGGTPPYRWAVNGIPLPPTEIGVTPDWLPAEVGFARLSVTDSANHSSSEMIRVQ
jgi:penicillin-binding protein 1C